MRGGGLAVGACASHASACIDSEYPGIVAVLHARTLQPWTRSHEFYPLYDKYTVPLMTLICAGAGGPLMGRRPARL